MTKAEQARVVLMSQGFITYANIRDATNTNHPRDVKIRLNKLLRREGKCLVPRRIDHMADNGYHMEYVLKDRA